MENLDELEQQEKILANSLRAVCTPYGDERESLLHESSDILFSMGRLYTKKAEITHGMEQKLNFIKSATLLHGARVRFEMFLSDRKRLYAVLCAAKEMEKSLIKACKGRSYDLMKLSSNIKRRFKALREIEKREVTKLEIITDDMPLQEAEKKRSEKIEHVQYLLKKNTTNFKELMQHIATKCLKIFGHPPCEFAMAGMGSLARGDITLYSDFEHAVILDEGVQDLPSYESIKEYFRWFAVLFQVIIIGLGETLIPSVGVKSINDVYSSDKSKNWFYDAYTPSAVAIDGMMPHACKNPLGRQKVTLKKGHTVELIQPVSEMALFLTKAEDLRNGYHLKEMLRQSCFVFGSGALFSYFQIQTHGILKSESNFSIMQQFSELREENVNPDIRGLGKEVLDKFDLDTKAIFYRPLTVVVSYMMRLETLNMNGTLFDFISQSSLFATFFQLNHAMWALAAACELRLKCYAVENGSRKKVIKGRVSDFLGDSCLVKCGIFSTQLMQLMEAMHQKTLRFPVFHGQLGKAIGQDVGVLQLKSKGSQSFGDGTFMTFLSLGRWDKAKPILLEEEKFLSASSSIKHKQRVLDQLASLYHYEAIKSTDENTKMELYEKAKDLVLSYEGGFKSVPNICILIEAYIAEGSHRDALKSLEIFFSTPGRDKDADAMLRLQQQKAVVSSMSPQQAFDYFENHVATEEDIPSQVAFRLGLAVCKIKLDMKEEGKIELRKLVDYALRYGPAVVNKFRMLDFLHEIFIQQIDNEFFDDADNTHERRRVVMHSKVKFDDPSWRASTFQEPDMAGGLLMIAKNQQTQARRIYLVEEAIDICYQAEKTTECLDMYLKAIEILISQLDGHPESSDLQRFAILFQKSPTDIQNNVNVRSYLVFKLGSYFHHCEVDMMSTKFFQMSSTVMILLEVFPFIVIHPLVVPFLYSMLSLLTHCLYCPGLTELYSNKKVVNYIPGQNYETVCTKFIHFISNDVKHVAVLSWRSLLLCDSASNMECFIRHLLGVVIVTLSGRLWSKLEICCRKYLSFAPPDSFYRKGIHHWMQHILPNPYSGPVFWKELQSPKTSLCLRRECIRMICHTIVLNSYEHGLCEPPLTSGFLTVVNKKFS